MALYVKELDYGTPLARKTAAIVVSAVLVSLLILPILSVAARVVA